MATKQRINLKALALKQETIKKKAVVLERVYRWLSGGLKGKPCTVSFHLTDGLLNWETLFKSRNLQFYKEARKELRALGFKVKQVGDVVEKSPSGIFLEWQITRT